MNYERFEKAAAINSEFDVIPSKTSILARGIIIDNNGYMQYKGKTYLPNMTKLSDLPGEIRDLFIEKKLPAQNQSKEVNVEIEKKGNDNFDNLNKILFEQLQNIVDPEKGTDISQELKKANAICNIADKVIGIADLSLKAEMFSYKKKYPGGKSLYQD
ncbi:hypothetical protein N5T63_09335 [Aliarcobacter cryaerophilus]|uniref:hypothetical protein n=1 Tax=Aliarcobacter cryaerophilus TaxID=28198 RepID=UPI0021B5A9F0|nr:hypothetical protein [Aliarcobacter cryaerophilus]MCT7489099.1 hypothetical protein [Aliarcobacter cryaerophilus]